MSERPARRPVRQARAALVGVALVALTIGAGALGAQARSLKEALKQRRDVQYQHWVTMRSLDSLESVRGRSRLTDTLRARDVTIASEHEVADSARLGLAVMEQRLRDFSLGGEPELGATYLLNRHLTDEPPEDTTKVFWYLARVQAGGRPEPIEWWQGRPRPAWLGFKIADDRRKRASARLPLAFVQWLGTPPMDSTVQDLWATVYAGIATSATLVGKRCLIGDLAGCRQALRLEVSKDPIVEWFTPETRLNIARMLKERVRDWAKDSSEHRSREPVYAAAIRCIDTADDPSCIAFLHAFAPDAANEPLQSGAGRQALVIAALQMNGAPGFSAIYGKSTGAVAAIEAIAGAPLDRVIARWRERAVAAEPERTSLSAPRVLAALTWVFGLGFLGLRGTRWR
jgi:hypothetical protein